MKKLLWVFLCLLLLTACGKKQPPVIETPPAPPVTEEVPVQPEPVPEVPERGYDWQDAPSSRTWDTGVRVSMVIPVFTGENQAALDIINDYFALLESKVLDYAEGDISPAAGESYVVNAEYYVHLATEHVLSLDWKVFTTEETKNTATGGIQYLNFDPATGGLLTFRDIFTDVEAARSAFVQQAREIIQQDPNKGRYFEHWYDLADSALDIDRFSYTENGIAVYYSQDDIGAFTAVELTWEELAMYLET